MPKKSRARPESKKKPIHPLVSKIIGVFAVVVFAGFPILMGIYLLAMALGGFLYNHQDTIQTPPFVRALYGFDLPPGAAELIEQGIPEDVVAAYKVYGDSRYELDMPVMPIAYSNRPIEVTVTMGRLSATRGAWRGSAATLKFPGETIEGTQTRTEEWKDSITGRVMDVYPWATYTVELKETALHTYLQAEASLDVTYAKPLENSREWRRETTTLTRPLRFYVLAPDELKQLHQKMPTPDSIRLPLMNPLNPVFWGIILIGSGIWILNNLRQQRIAAQSAK